MHTCADRLSKCFIAQSIPPSAFLTFRSLMIIILVAIKWLERIQFQERPMYFEFIYSTDVHAAPCLGDASISVDLGNRLRHTPRFRSLV